MKHKLKDVIVEIHDEFLETHLGDSFMDKVLGRMKEVSPPKYIQKLIEDESEGMVRVWVGQLFYNLLYPTKSGRFHKGFQKLLSCNQVLKKSIILKDTHIEVSHEIPKEEVTEIREFLHSSKIMKGTV